MELLNQDTAKLLAKLYNLRGEDSVILSQMETERQTAEATKSRTAKEKEDLQKKINNLTQEVGTLKTQGEKLRGVLTGINQTDYNLVITKLGLDFKPRELKAKLDQALPQTIDLVTKETKKAEEQLKNIEAQMNDAITKIEELALRKDNALTLQAKLNEYFDLALNGNINLTRDAITSLLERFGFADEEQREGAKLLMFPEDALYEYDRTCKGGKSISEVIAEAKGISENNSVQVEVTNENDKIPITDIVPDALSKVKKLLHELGLDDLDYSKDSLMEIAASFDEEVIRNNIEYAKTVQLELDLFADNTQLLTDPEFINKVEKLFSLNKTVKDIYLSPTILVKYDYDELVHAIELIDESGLDPKVVPLMAF